MGLFSKRTLRKYAAKALKAAAPVIVSIAAQELAKQAQGKLGRKIEKALTDHISER